MTIRLLSAYSIYPVNAIVTLDAGTEAGLVAAKTASTNLTGGVVYVPPNLPNQLSAAQVVKDGAGNVLGLADANGKKLDGIGAAATLTGNFIIGQTITATLPPGIVGTLQFTRTLAVSPFTKTNIAGAVANAVNSLTYQLQNADGGYVPGVDASNQVSPTVGGAVPAAPTPMRVATVNNHIYQQASTSAGNDLMYFDYECQVGSAPLAKISPAMIGAWYLDPATNTVVNTPGYTVMDMAVENAAGTLVVRFPFGGAGTTGLAVTSGQNYVPLGDLDASALEPSLNALPRGYKMRIKGWVKASAVSAALPTCGYNSSGGQQFWTVTGNSLGLTDILTPGFWKTSANALPPANGATTNSVIMPAILGTYAAGADPMTWFCTADSEGWGTGDVTSTVFGAGLFQRALRGDGTAGQLISGLSFAVAGVKLDPWITDSRLVFWSKFCRGAVIDIQTNNFGTSNVWTAAQAEAMEDQLYPLLRAQGISKILREDFLARTTSTDAWATEANQTYQPGWGPGGNVNQYRVKLTAKVGTLIDQLVSKAQARGTDTDKYITNGTANYSSFDGTHLTGVPLTQISTNLRTAMDSYT